MPSPITERVQDQYTRYPYPPVMPTANVIATFGLMDYVKFVLWPGRPDLSGLRVLDAGTGTGQTAVQIAQKCPEAEVLGIDLSETSLAAARAEADRVGVGNNLTFRQWTIEDVAALGLKFDYIIASGVLHHLADPDAGMRALASVLSPDGGMAVMLYGTYGRHGVYLLQDLLRRLVGDRDLAEQAAFARKLVRRLPVTHPLKPDEWLDLQWTDDAGLVDLLLHVRDRSYTVPEVYGLVEQAGLRLERFYKPLTYNPKSYFLEEDLSAGFDGLDPREQAVAAELLHGGMSQHKFFATHAGYEPLRIEPEGAVLFSLRPKRSPLFLWNDTDWKTNDAGEERLVLSEMLDGSSHHRTLEFSPWNVLVLSYCDGSLTAHDILRLPDVFGSLPGDSVEEKVDRYGKFMELMGGNEILLFEP
jgi:SAM-dependent methyltransferase